MPCRRSLAAVWRRAKTSVLSSSSCCITSQCPPPTPIWPNGCARTSFATAGRWRNVCARRRPTVLCAAISTPTSPRGCCSGWVSGLRLARSPALSTGAQSKRSAISCGATCSPTRGGHPPTNSLASYSWLSSPLARRRTAVEGGSRAPYSVQVPRCDRLCVRPLHGSDGHDGRQRGATDAGAAVSRGHQRTRMGRDRLSTLAGDLDPGVGLDRGPLRYQEDVHLRAHDVHARLGVVGRGVEHRIADRLPHPAGGGGGMLTPVGVAMLFRAFPPHERAKASTVLTVPTTIAPAIGPLLGGWLVDNA